MIISLIAAYDRNRLIGRGNDLPWPRLKADFAWFRDKTIGKAVIMGRTTYQSILERNGNPLPNRSSVILTRDPDFVAPGCFVAHSVEEALRLAKEARPGNEVVVIGGAQIFAQFLPQVDRIYLTEIDGEFIGDVFFPSYSQEDWKEIERKVHQPDADNQFRCTFLVLERYRLIFS